MLKFMNNIKLHITSRIFIWKKVNESLKFPNIVDGQATTLQLELQNVLKASAPTSNNQNQPQRIPYWNLELDRIKRIVRVRRKCYQAIVNPDLRRVRLSNYREMKEIYQIKIEDARRQIWERFLIRSIESDPWGTPYKLISEKVKSPMILTTMRKQDGSLTSTWRNTLDT